MEKIHTSAQENVGVPLDPAYGNPPFSLECLQRIGAQEAHAKNIFLTELKNSPHQVGSFRDEDYKVFCREGALYWNVLNFKEHLLDRDSFFCQCRQETMEGAQAQYDAYPCLNERLKALEKEPHYAKIHSKENSLRCLQGNLVRETGINTSAPSSLRVLERNSPFCQCPQTNCDLKTPEACAAPEMCMAGMCRAFRPSCDRSCVEQKRKALEAEIIQALSDNSLRKDIFVSTQGDDAAGDGTLTHPFKSLARAFQAIQGPTTFHVSAGRYDLLPQELNNGNLVIEGAGRDQTLLRVLYRPEYFQEPYQRLFLVDHSRFVLKNLSIETLWREPNGVYDSIFKITHALNFYNSKVLIDHVDFKNFNSNQFFGVFNSVFHFKDMQIGGGGYKFTGDLIWDIIHGQGIIENVQVINTKSGGGANIDHIVDVRTLPLPPTSYFQADKIAKQGPNRLIIRNNYFMGRDNDYGDGLRIQPHDPFGHHEYYILNNKITKDPLWDKEQNGTCHGIRIKVEPQDILEFRGNDLSEHCVGVALQGEPFDWTGAMLFEGNSIHHNRDEGLNIGAPPQSSMYSLDLGSRPFPFMDFGGGAMGSYGGNKFYNNGYIDVHYGFGSDLYIRNNYWGTIDPAKIKIKKDQPAAQVILTPLRDQFGNIVVEAKPPQAKPFWRFW